MTTFNNTTKSNELYPVANGITSSSPFVVEFQARAPTTSDVNYPIQKQWLDTSTDNFWFLKNFTSTGGIVLANWIQITSGTNPIDEIMVDTFTAPGTNPVFPDASGLMTITGGQVAASTTNNVIRTDSLAPNTFTIEIQRSQAVGVSTIGDNGVSHFDSGSFNVDANGFVTLKGGSQAIDSIQVDASTPPGTNPVLPTVAGLVTVTGGQVAAGTTSNVIRTDSLAANTYTIQVQRSQAVGVSTVGDNGVSHYNSTDFTVDANGFVQLVNSGPYISLSPFIVGTDIHSGYATIAAGIAAAVAAGATNTTPMNVYVKPKTNGTVYTENLTLSPGVNLVAFGGSVSIVGKLSFSSAGQVIITGFNLITNSDYFLEVTGANASIVVLTGCILLPSNNDGIHFSSSNASSEIIIKHCEGDVSANGFTYWTMSSVGGLSVSSSGLGNSGLSTVASNNSAGIVNIVLTAMGISLANSGTGGTGIINCNIDAGNTNTIGFLANGTGPNNIRNSFLAGGTASALSIGAGATVTASNLIVNSSNVNVLTGAGTLNYAFISFEGASSGHNVTTENALATLI